MIGNGIARADQPEEEAERQDVLELELAAHVAPEHVPSAQSTAAPSAWTIGTRPLAVGSSGCGWLNEPEAEQAGSRNQAKRGRGRSRGSLRAASDRDQRLDLLEHDRRDEVAVEERLGEEDRRERRGAGPDRRRPQRCIAASLRDRSQRRQEQRQRQGTRMTCSPNTIVVARRRALSGLRRIGSVPHIAAATAMSSTPGPCRR